jgi:hypothetical protein
MQNITYEMELRLTELLKAKSDARADADVAWAANRAAIANASTAGWMHDPAVLETADKARKADRAYCVAILAEGDYRREIRAAGYR